MNQIKLTCDDLGFPALEIDGVYDESVLGVKIEARVGQPPLVTIEYAPASFSFEGDARVMVIEVCPACKATLETQLQTR